MGKDILDSKLSMEDISDLVLEQDINPQSRSGRQEHLENRVNRYF